MSAVISHILLKNNLSATFLLLNGLLQLSAAQHSGRDDPRAQRMQNSSARIVVEVPGQSDAKPVLRRLHWLLVEQGIVYKMAVPTFKVRNTTKPVCLNHHTDGGLCMEPSLIQGSIAGTNVQEN